MFSTIYRTVSIWLKKIGKKSIQNNFSTENFFRVPYRRSINLEILQVIRYSYLKFTYFNDLSKAESLYFFFTTDTIPKKNLTHRNYSMHKSMINDCFNFEWNLLR